jgi:hypothetical protein
MEITACRSNHHYLRADCSTPKGPTAANCSADLTLLWPLRQHVKFSPVDGDHHLGRFNVTVSIPPSEKLGGPSVTVLITYGLRDWSGNWDDRYEGDIYFAVLGQ